MHNKSIWVFLPLPINFSKSFFEEETNSIHSVSVSCSSYFKIYVSSFSKLCNNFSKVFFKKLKFKGKGYYIYKSARNTIAPQFGYSHRIYIYSWGTGIKFTSKTSVLVFGFVSNLVMKTSHELKSYRSINVFTGRGVRFSKQIVYSKPGKVASYR